MKTISLVGCQAAEVLCRLAPIPVAKRLRCVSDLHGLGFFDFVERRNLEPLQERVMRTGDIFGEDSNKVVFIDCEDLFERGVEVLLDTCRGVLALRGKHFTRILGRDTSHEHVVEIDGALIRVWAYDEFEDVESKWCLAGGRAVRLLNLMLKETSHAELAFLHHTGNDSRLVLLTLDQKAVLESVGSIHPCG